jgi:hypothetical protein
MYVYMLNNKWILLMYRSSVTAGHDNYFKEAYPQVFEEAFRPILDSIGMLIHI